MTSTINYESIYDNDISDQLKSSLDMPTRYLDLTPDQRLYLEELVDAGSNRTLEEALDPEVLAETSGLAAEMGTQLYQFANMLNDHLSIQNNNDLISPNHGNQK